MVGPILPIQLKEIDFDEELFGYIFTVYSLISAASTLVWGAIIHITGRKIILVISALAMGISTFLFSFLNFLPDKNLIILACFIVRVIEGFSSGLKYCAVDSIIAILYRENQVEYLSYITTTEAVIRGTTNWYLNLFILVIINKDNNGSQTGSNQWW